jgi:hypothetical protein
VRRFAERANDRRRRIELVLEFELVVFIIVGVFDFVVELVLDVVQLLEFGWVVVELGRLVELEQFGVVNARQNRAREQRRRRGRPAAGPARLTY